MEGQQQLPKKFVCYFYGDFDTKFALIEEYNFYLPYEVTKVNLLNH